MVNLRTMAESIRGLFKPVTVQYPAKPSPPAEGYMGKPEFDLDKCIGCGGCVETCPSKALSLEDAKGKRVVRVLYGHCSFCGRCEDICPEEAIELTPVYELAVYRKNDASSKVSVELAKCRRCRGYFAPSRQLSRIAELAEETLKKRDQSPKMFDRMLMVCPDCRAEPKGLVERKRFLSRFG